MMRTFRVVLTCGVLAACLHGQAANGTSQRKPVPIINSTRLVMTVEIASATVKVGTPIVVKIRLKNVSPDPIDLIEILPDVDYQFLLLDDSGKEVSKTPYGARTLDLNGCCKGIVVRAGEEVQEMVDITKIHQLTQPGIYHFRVWRRGIKSRPPAEMLASEERVYSNPITVTIIP